MSCTRATAIVLLSILSASLASADDGSGEALRADRQRIQGRWQVVELTVDGRTTPAEDVRKLMVVNGVDGSWRLLSDGSEWRVAVLTASAPTRRTARAASTSSSVPGKVMTPIRAVMTELGLPTSPR